jgi:hypothetical protein
MLNCGIAFTVTVLTVVLLHPLLSVPLTVYVVFTTGLTVTLVVFAFVFHVYVLAPLTVKVAASPLHINALPLILKVGKLYTVTARVAVFPLHPAALRPFKLYVVLTVGVTPILLALLLVLHVYVLAPFAVSVTP